MNQTGPSVIATGDFLYFAPGGQAFTIPAAGMVGSTSKPGPTDPIWTSFALGTVKKPTVDKFTGKPVTVSAPMPGTGIVAPTNIIRPTVGLEMTVEMNELSRTALAGFYKSPLIQLTDTSFYPLSRAAALMGWLKRQRYDAANGQYIIDDWWVDVDVSELKTDEENILHPTFMFTWIYSPLAGSGI